MATVVLTAPREHLAASIALAVFGGIAALAALIIAGQVIGRQLRLGARDLGTLRALGASPAMTVSDGLPGVIGAVAAGSLLAAAVAVALSPLGPLGSVREVYPIRASRSTGPSSAGARPRWPACCHCRGGDVLPQGAAPRPREASRPRRPRRGPARYTPSGGRASGLPAAAAEGIRLALDPGTGRTRVPVRSAILGTVLAMVVTVATVTFGASLQTRSSPTLRLYGWNWTYGLSAGIPSFIPRRAAAALLGHDRDVAAWTGIYFASAQIDGQTVPVIGMSPGAPVGPAGPFRARPAGPGQIVLGPATLAQLHKRVGDVVTVDNGGGGRFRLRIAGTATLPSLGIHRHPAHRDGRRRGAPVPARPGAERRQPERHSPTLRPGANAPGRARPAEAGPVAKGGQVFPSAPGRDRQLPVDGNHPVYLAAALAAGAVSPLWLTLLASVRRRRTELALLKTLGFTRRQLAAAVAWQSTTAVAAGTVVGVPLGIALGRFLWDLFARQISVVPEPTIPGLTIVLVSRRGTRDSQPGSRPARPRRPRRTPPRAAARRITPAPVFSCPASAARGLPARSRDAGPLLAAPVTVIPLAQTHGRLFSALRPRRATLPRRGKAFVAHGDSP